MSGYQHAMYARFGKQNVRFVDGKVYVAGRSTAGAVVWQYMGNV